jgi:UTP--glucose-1-phosphate uridylyltransferase
MLELVQNILPNHVNCIHVRQSEPLGLGHAVLCGRAAVGNEPFAVLLADDLIDDDDRGCLKQMVNIYDIHKSSVIAVENVPKEETDKYGIVSSDDIDSQLGILKGNVEKPLPAKAPSTKAVVGRYILTSEVFNILEHIGTGAGGEIQLTDAIAELLKKEKVFSWAFEGKRYDCGSKLGYLKATFKYALMHVELKNELSNYLENKEYL